MSSVVFNKCSVASQAKRFGGVFFSFFFFFLLCGHCMYHDYDYVSCIDRPDAPRSRFYSRHSTVVRLCVDVSLMVSHFSHLNVTRTFFF